MKLVTAAEMKKIEQKAEEMEVTTSELMLNAGYSVFTALTRLNQFNPDLTGNDLEDGLIVVLAGSGNNGGDAMVIASLLKQEFSEAEVKIYLHKRPRPEDGFSDKLTYTEAEEQEGQDLSDEVAFDAFFMDLQEAVLVIDGLLGSGLSRKVTGELAEIIKTVNEAREARQFDPTPLFVTAIDVPSGLNSDTGEVMGVALQADLTVTLGLPKRGLYNYKAVEYSGAISLGDIGLPEELLEELEAQVEKEFSPALITATDVRRWLPPRPVIAHKGTFGKLMVVSGSEEYLGAPYLCTVAAMRAGAGLVTLASSRNVIEVMASRSSENTYFELKLPVSEEESVLPIFEQRLGDYQGLLLGPGLGEFGWRQGFVLSLDVTQLLKVVIDADGLNFLARTPDWWEDLLAPGNILTPHPAELGRLMESDVATIEADRIKSASEAAKKFKQVVILKGAYTVVAAPDGRVRINPAANPALATAGSGDVLAGICAGLATQAARLDNYDAFNIACCGVYLHSMAGELARRELGDCGVLAGDLLALIPKAISALKDGDSLE